MDFTIEIDAFFDEAKALHLTTLQRTVWMVLIVAAIREKKDSFKFYRPGLAVCVRCTNREIDETLRALHKNRFIEWIPRPEPSKDLFRIIPHAEREESAS